MSKDKNRYWPKPVEANSENFANPSSKNALKHGCCAASTLILPHENESDYRALENTWLKAYNPQTDHERHLVQELVNADWLLQRTTAAYAKIESDLYTVSPNPSGWTESHERKLGRHLRYRTAQTNLVLKARKAIEDFRKNRLNEQAQLDKQSITQERLRVYKAKNRLQPAIPEKAFSVGCALPEPPIPDPTRAANSYSSKNLQIRPGLGQLRPTTPPQLKILPSSFKPPSQTLSSYSFAGLKRPKPTPQPPFSFTNHRNCHPVS